MILTRLNPKGESLGTESLDLDYILRENSNHLVYLSQYYQFDRLRSGTASFKSRKDVRGGGRKPYKQKGTGRARRGTSRSPLLPGGGKAFGRVARDLSSKLPKKVMKQGIKATLAFNQDKLCILDAYQDITQAKQWRSFFDSKKQYVCIIHDSVTGYALRNYPNVQLAYSHQLSVQALLTADVIVIFSDALPVFQELYCVTD